MRKSTVALFGTLIMVVVAAVTYFQFHQHHLLSVAGGSMSLSTKKHFWSLGIDCQEVYEMQGYESAESLYKMFGLTQHQFYQLNPGIGLNAKQGDILCVKGLYDVSAHAMNTFWPLAVGGALAVTGLIAALYAKLKSSR